MARHNLHSFTLAGAASKIISEVGRGKKSAYASKAIIWFSKPQEVITEKHWVGEFGHEVVVPHHEVLDLSDFVMSQRELMRRYAKINIENEKLREELDKNESFISKMLKLFRK